MNKVIVVLLLVALPVGAAPPSVSAREHYERGTTAFDLGRYGESAHEYEEAYAMKTDPALLFNIGQAYRLANDNVNALRSYRAFLRRVPGAPNRATVEAHIATLQRLVEDQKRASSMPPTGTIALGQSKATAEPVEPRPPGEPARVIAPAVEPVRAPAVEPVRAAAVERRPLYKRWWLWTAVGAVVAVGVGVGVGVALSSPHNANAPAGAPTIQF